MIRLRLMILKQFLYLPLHLRIPLLLLYTLLDFPLETALPFYLTAEGATLSLIDGSEDPRSRFRILLIFIQAK